MNMSVIVVIIAKLVIAVLYGFEFMRYNRAKRLDNTIKVKFDIRSWIEVIVVGGLNIGLMVYPNVEQNVVFLTFYAFVMLAVTFFHTRRLVVIGKKVIFILEHSFKLTDLSRVTYEKGVMKFLIKGQAFKLRLPLGDMEYVMQRLSGKYYKKG
ncbi:hypothetical protein G7062_05945 [Erysipelothrix sp. HDW6C]|uniref:hypothetical protein n=1 Tax=Erysipelothrix sp. HDW6C TaxID=2714930 RepID=UPI00140BAD74|nr:hypothetical protein [Erysipelothrix sp. HDW6C]QIK69861.1 hypothetical protein G7062_05945 [Erysipelothrix sp. HDW6C]